MAQPNAFGMNAMAPSPMANNPFGQMGGMGATSPQMASNPFAAPMQVVVAIIMMIIILICCCQ